jgi:hypothetical protein
VSTAKPHEARQFVHVGVPKVYADEIRRNTREAGISVIDLGLEGVTSTAGLCQRLSEVFMYPHETRGLDAAIDLISDLEWFGSERGYLVLISGLDGVPPEVAGDLGGIWPNILNRWRAGRTTFLVIALEAGAQPTFEDQVHLGNAQMDAAGSLPWARPGTGRIDIEDGPWDKSMLI